MPPAYFLNASRPPGGSLNPIGYRYRTLSYASGRFDAYFFEKNLQGDVIAVGNKNGVMLRRGITPIFFFFEIF